MFIDTGQAEARVLVRYFYEIADEPKELWEIPETHHGGQLEARPLEYEEKMISFFDDTLQMRNARGTSDKKIENSWYYLIQKKPNPS